VARAPNAKAGTPTAAAPTESKTVGWKPLIGPLIGVVIGGLISAGTAYLTSRLTAEGQRQQFLVERSQAFSEFLSLYYLPLSGSVSQECQTRLEECRRLRQEAIQTYLFLPTPIQKELIRSFGPDAVAAVAPNAVKGLKPEAAAFDNALRLTREWLTGYKDADFNFILPCADWKLEEKQCAKK
jgi:hypothetical protein